MKQGRGWRAARATAAAGPAAILLLVAVLEALAGRPYLCTAALVAALLWLIGAALALEPRVRWLLPAVVPLMVGAAAGLLWLSDVGTLDVLALPAKGATAIGLVTLGLLVVGVQPAKVLHRTVFAVGTGLTAVFGVVAFAFFVLPAWGWTRVRRLDPIRPGRATGPVWSAVDLAGADDADSLGSTRSGDANRRPLAARVAWAVGCVVLLVAGNYGIGLAWDRATTDPAPEPDASVPERRFEGKTVRDPRIDEPAMAAYPWRAEYFDTIQRTTGGYWPFTEYRPNDFTSRYVNQRGWRRGSYEPVGPVESMPSVWMFGGSTTWGEGQRDEYTIASYLARIAEAEGVPLWVANYGQRGWTHFQEMILFEQQLVSEPDPDLAIFYDGANELTTQSLLEEAVPSHTLAYSYARKLTGSTIATELVQDPAPPDLAGDLRDAYVEHSAVHKLVGLLRGDPAGATPAQDVTTTAPAPSEGFTGGQVEERGAVYDYNISEQDGVDGGRVYERGKAFTRMVGEQHDVDTLLFWQPTRYRSPALDAARAQLTPPTIDITDCLEDHPDVFIDGGHTNERGAELVAEEIWIHLEPRVRAWYEQNG